jgi:hypothetical protein
MKINHLLSQLFTVRKNTCFPSGKVRKKPENHFHNYVFNLIEFMFVSIIDKNVYR